MEPEFCCGRHASKTQGYDEGEIHFSDYRLLNSFDSIYVMNTWLQIEVIQHSNILLVTKFSRHIVIFVNYIRSLFEKRFK